MWFSSILGSWQLKAALLVISFLAGWKVNGWRHEAEAALIREAKQAMVDAYREEEAKAATVLENKLKDLKANEKIIEKERVHLVDRPVYSNICLDDDGVRLIERARTGKTDSSKPTD